MMEKPNCEIVKTVKEMTFAIRDLLSTLKDIRRIVENIESHINEERDSELIKTIENK